MFGFKCFSGLHFVVSYDIRFNIFLHSWAIVVFTVNELILKFKGKQTEKKRKTERVSSPFLPVSVILPLF